MGIERKTVYQVLSTREDWGELSQLLRTICTQPPIDEERLRGILEVVPSQFSLGVGRSYYALAFGGGIHTEEERGALQRICEGTKPALTIEQVAGILNRACWQVNPAELL